MARYRGKPVEVEAVLWTGDNLDEVHDLVEGSRDVLFDASSRSLIVRTAEGRTMCSMGTWLLRGDEGGFSTYSANAFEGAYELAERTPYDPDVVRAEGD